KKERGSPMDCLSLVLPQQSYRSSQLILLYRARTQIINPRLLAGKGPFWQENDLPASISCQSPETRWKAGRLPRKTRRKHIEHQRLVAVGAACQLPREVGRLAGTLPVPPSHGTSVDLTRERFILHF